MVWSLLDDFEQRPALNGHSDAVCSKLPCKERVV